MVETKDPQFLEPMNSWILKYREAVISGIKLLLSKLRAIFYEYKLCVV